MDVFEAVRTVLAVRSYQEKPVPEDLVQRIVEAGRLTASSVNRQPWHFVVIDDPALLRELGGAISTGPYVAQAPLAIAVAVQKSSPYGVSDGSRAVQSMILTAWDQGVASNWVGFAGGMPAAQALLGLPDELDLLAIVPFGYPTDDVGKGKKNRKPLAEVASHNRFGTPLE